MFIASLLALSLSSAAAPADSSVGYGCRAVDGQAPACAASPIMVAQGKGAISGRAAKPRTMASAAPTACHPDPVKGRVCRHNNIQAETAATNEPALALQDAAH